MKTAIPADVRALIVRQLDAALADAWRRQQRVVEADCLDRDDGNEKDLAGARDAGQVRL